jgi:predicted Zn-dependent protease
LISGVLPAVLLAVIAFFIARPIIDARAWLQLQSDPQAAVESLDQWQGWVGESPRTLWLRADAARRLNNARLTKSNSDAAIRRGLDPDIAQQPLWLAQAAAGNTDNAEQHLAPLLLAYHGDESTVYDALLGGYLVQARLGNGGDLIELWKSDDGTNPRIGYWEGMYYSAEYQLDNAIACLEQVVDQDAQMWEARRELARLYIERVRLPEAEQQFKALAQLRPDDTSFRQNYADCLAQLGKTQEAAEQVQLIPESNQNYSDVLYLRAKIALDANQVAEAIELTQTITERWPNVAQYATIRAEALVLNNQRDAADPFFERAEASRRKRDEIGAIEAQVEDRPGDLQQRLAFARMMMTYLSPGSGHGQAIYVLAQDNQNAEAHRLISDYYQREGERKLAEQHAAKAARLTQASTNAIAN